MPGSKRDTGSIHGSGRSPGGGHGIPLQYSCQENPMDRGAWRAMVHVVEKSRTRRDLACTQIAYYSDMRKKEILPFVKMWMKPEGAMLSEIT